MNHDINPAPLRPGELLFSRTSGLSGELLPDAGDGWARIRETRSGLTVVCRPEDLEAVDRRAEIAERAERESTAVYCNMFATARAAGVTDAQLADRSGVPEHTISAVGDGDEELSVTQLVLLALALDVRPGEWFRTADVPEVTR
ncbi:hypothetical protein [Nocardia flavorosea]|uniref:HTH cro/C1-type domain-containing protein n=1 Tax=Nocardia flavorosea TaxID=53429 RepID=A0A846YHY4_9NOCA|nr:hypothetical protein [Nocardia flavorosea]NKY57222.1 hypothetical protein [Nocardia flavorosea]